MKKDYGMGNNYQHYFFVDKESGEEFYVDAFTLQEAKDIAKEYFDKPKFISIDDDFVFEMNGVDVY